jgi:hypothetical protein
MRVPGFIRHTFRNRMAELMAMHDQEEAELDLWLADLSSPMRIDWLDPSSRHAALTYIEPDPAWWQDYGMRMGAKAALLQQQLHDAHRELRTLRQGYVD